MLNFNDNSFRTIAINDLSAINYHIDDDTQDPNTSVLSVHDNLENLISSHRNQLRHCDEDDDELYDPSVSGLLSMRDSPINTKRGAEVEQHGENFEQTSHFNNRFDSFEQKKTNHTQMTNDLSQYATGETSNIMVLSENINIQNMPAQNRSHFLNISQHMLGDQQQSTCSMKERKKFMMKNTSTHSAQTKMNFNKFNSTAKFRNNHKHFQNQSMCSANQSFSGYSEASKELAHIPSLSIGLTSRSFFKKNRSMMSYQDAALPKLECYPECEKMAFDPTKINKEQEFNEDFLDLAKNLLDMCKSLRTTIRQNIACQNNRRVIKVQKEFGNKLEMVESGKKRIHELHSVNVF